MAVVGRERGVDFGPSVIGDQRPEGLVEQDGVGSARLKCPSVLEKILVNGSTHAYARHATSMP